LPKLQKLMNRQRPHLLSGNRMTVFATGTGSRIFRTVAWKKIKKGGGTPLWKEGKGASPGGKDSPISFVSGK